MPTYIRMKHSLVLRLKEHSDEVRVFAIATSVVAQRLEYHVIRWKGTKVLRWTPTHWCPLYECGYVHLLDTTTTVEQRYGSGHSGLLGTCAIVHPLGTCAIAHPLGTCAIVHPSVMLCACCWNIEIKFMPLHEASHLWSLEFLILADIRNYVLYL